MNKNDEILKKIGLTTAESKTYLTLLKLQEAQTGVLCKHTKIASSNIYQILDSLAKKGLVSYRVQNNTKIFMPASPDTLNDLFKEKQKQIEKERIQIIDVIEHLKKIKPETQAYSNYKYFEGFSGVKALWHELNDIMTNEDTIRIHSGKREGYERLLGFYTEHHKLRVKKKIKEHLIYPLGEEKLARSRLKMGFTEIRTLDLKNLGEWGIVNDTVFIQHIEGRIPRGFLIKDKIFAIMFKQVFDQLWETAQKIKS